MTRPTRSRVSSRPPGTPPSSRSSAPKRERVPLTPQEQVERQKQRARLTSGLLMAALICQGLMLLGGVTMWMVLSGPVPEGSTVDVAERARLLLPAVRLMTLYTLLLLIVTALARKVVRERRPQAFALTLSAVVLMFFGFPIGTLAALFFSFFLPPRRWLDLRQHQSQENAAAAR